MRKIHHEGTKKVSGQRSADRKDQEKFATEVTEIKENSDDRKDKGFPVFLDTDYAD